MRRGICVWVGLASITSCLFAQHRETWCASGTSYTQMQRENVASLRWSLYSLAELDRIGVRMDPEVARIADNSVSSLANLYLLRGRYVQDCSVARDDYYAGMAANEKFISLLLATTSREEFPPAVNLAEKGWFVVGSATESIEGKEITFNETIRTTIEKRRAGLRPNHPVSAACSLLLGQREAPDEREISADANLAPLNQDLEVVRAPYSDSLSLLNKQDWKSALLTLARYYVSLK